MASKRVKVTQGRRPRSDEKPTGGTVTAILEELDDALRRTHPKLHASLRPGASAASLKSFEAKLGIRVPRAFIDFHAWHDGVGDESPCWREGTRLLPLKGVLGVHAMMTKNLKDGSFAEWQKEEWWSPGWIPFLDSESYNVVLDTSGSFGGQSGQVIRVALQSPDRWIETGSFEKWLETYTAFIAKGYMEIVGDDFLVAEKSRRSATAVAKKVNPGYPIQVEAKPAGKRAGSSPAVDSLIKKHQSATELNLSGRQLTEVPDLSSLGKLENVNLSNNPIGRLNADRLPKNIRALVVSGCGLSELPSNLDRLAHLERLQAGRNSIASLQESVGKLPKLKALRLDANKFSEFPAIISRMSSLEDLDLSRNGLTELPGAIARLSELVRQLGSPFRITQWA